LVPFGSERRTLAPGESCATRPPPEFRVSPVESSDARTTPGAAVAVEEPADLGAGVLAAARSPPSLR